MCINCVIRQEEAEDERRRLGLNNGKDGQGSSADQEMTPEEFPKDWGVEVVEPRPEPDPSVRNEFHQVYTKKSQAADKEVEDYSKTLDSVSYPALLSSGIILLLIDCETEPCSARFYGISAAVAVISLSLFTKQYLRRCSLQRHRRLLTTKGRGEPLTGLTYLTEGGTPLVALVVLSPFLLSQILSKIGKRFYATFGVVAVAFLTIPFVLVWGPTLLHTLVTKSLHPPAPSRAPPRLQRTLQSPPKNISGFSSAPGGGETQDSTASLTVTPILNPVGVDHQGNLADARRLTWMFERSSNSGIIHTTLRFALEVLWTPDYLQDAITADSALLRSYELLSDAFDGGHSTQPTMLRAMRGQAFAAAKAFVHIFIQGDYALDDPIITTLRDHHIPLGPSPSLRNDADLRSTVGIVDNILGVRKPVRWLELQLTSSHRLWLSHILLFRAWCATRHKTHIPDFVMDFVRHSLRSNPRPRLAVVADCVLVVGLIVGHPLHEADLLAWEKTQELPTILQKVSDRLKVAFGPTSTRVDIEDGLKALELFSPLCLHPVADGCHALFNAAVQSTHLPGEARWEVARLALYGAFKWDSYIPLLDDVKDVVTFFEHTLEFPSDIEEEQDMALQSAYRALGYASKREMLDQYDMKKPLVVDGTIAAFAHQKPLQFWRAILFFLDAVEGQWFNSGVEIMNEQKRREFIQKLADNMEHAEPTVDVVCTVLSILLGMADSPLWRPHLPISLWSVMGGFSALPETTPSFIRCRNNPDVIDGLRAYEEQSVVKFWMGVLWRDWVDLRPEVQARLVETTREVVGPGAEDHGLISAAIIGTHQQLSQRMEKFQPWSIEEEALACRARIEKLEQGRLKLEGVLVGTSDKVLPHG